MTEVELGAVLTVLRTALEGYWAAWAKEKNRPEVATGATMCRFTAPFLVRILGKKWYVAGGQANFAGDPAGFFDGKKWHGHYWVTDGERIVDLTAHQFGAEPIVLTTSADPRYSANYTKGELREAQQHVSIRARKWAQLYRAALLS